MSPKAGKRRKAFFFEKRTKKRLVSWRISETVLDRTKKFFASFFQKRSACLSSGGTIH